MSAVPASLHLGSSWRVALPALLALLLVIGTLYRDTAMAMVGIWSRSDTFAHAFMVPPISLWLIWRQRHALARLAPRPQPWMLVPMMGVAAIWLAADLVVVNAAAQFAWVALLVMAVPALLGLEVAGAILFPLMFLFFAVPFGEFLLPLLMEYTANFTVFALRLSGIPVYREGLQFVIPSGNWSVVEACSGVRYLIASFMIGTLFAYLNYRSTRRRLVFMAVSIVVPIFANWLRAYMIVMLGHFSGNTIAVGVDHLIYGWVFFGVVITIMFVIGARWSEPGATAPAAPAMPAARRGAEVSNTAFAGILLACVAVVTVPQLASDALQRPDAGTSPVHLVLPERFGDWQSDGEALASWRPKFVNPSIEAMRTYSLGGKTVGVFVAYYRAQGPERKLVGSQNVLAGAQNRGWNQVATGRRQQQVAGQEFTVKTAELLGPLASNASHRPRLVVWKAYWVNGRLVAGDAAAKFHTALAMLSGRGDDGAAVILVADAGESRTTANAVLQEFFEANVGKLEGLLRQSRDAR